MHTFLSWLGGLPPILVYVIAALVVFAETGLIVGFLLPGEITMITVGFLAFTGRVGLVAAILILILAAFAGDTVAYLAGRRAGPRLQASRLGHWVGPRRWSRAEGLFQRHGGRAVGVGRFVAFARTLTPRLAGMAGLPFRQVWYWDILGVSGCVAGSALIGYLAGTSYERVSDLFGRATGALLLLVLVIVALVLVGRYLGRHRHPVTAFGGRLVRTRPLHWLDRWYRAGFHRLTARFGPDGAVAVNLALGVPALLGIGFVLTLIVDRLVRHSGFPLIDPMIADWLAARRTPAFTEAALTTLSICRGSFLVPAVAVVGFAVNPRPRAWRADMLGALGTAGAFIPLLILALAADWARPAGAAGVLFPNQVTLATASLGMLAWLLAVRLPWSAAVAVWIVAIGAVLLVGGARMYVGFNWPSEVLASVLLGALWVLVFGVAWHTRDRLRPSGTGPGPGPEDIITASARRR